jgi:hypothetical protein
MATTRKYWFVGYTSTPYHVGGYVILIRYTTAESVAHLLLFREYFICRTFRKLFVTYSGYYYFTNMYLIFLY